MNTHEDRQNCLFLARFKANIDEMHNTHTIEPKFLIGPYKWHWLW